MQSCLMFVPPEILEAIMIFIDDDHISLAASSLVCSAWKDVSQRLLFMHRPLRLFRLLELDDPQMSNFHPLITRFQRLAIGQLAFVSVATTSKAGDPNVHERAIMIRNFCQPHLAAQYDLPTTGGTLPWMPLSFQSISTVELDGPIHFETYIVLRDFLAGFTNLEHLAFSHNTASVLKESSLPSWTGLRLKTLECRSHLVNLGLVRALLCWLAASDNPRLSTLRVGLRESPISPAFYIRDPLKSLLVIAKRTLRTLEVHISSCSDDCLNLRLSTWLMPDCSLETLHLFVSFTNLHTVIDDVTLPNLRHLKVTSPAYGDVRSAPSKDLLTRMTLPSLDRVSVTFSYVNQWNEGVLIQAFTSAKKREILQVTMEYEEECDLSFGLFD